MLEQPRYAIGDNWYGLGLDVQDEGETWSHTGAMEGTCGTAQRHHSGITWVFLLNSWAGDMDLDGAVKLALSSTPHLSPFPPAVACIVQEVVTVTTKDERQCIMAHLSLQQLQAEVCEKKQSGYNLSWVGINSGDHKRGRSLTFNAIFCQSVDLCERRLLVCEQLGQLKEILRVHAVSGFHPLSISTFTQGMEVCAIVIIAKQHQCSVREVDIGVPAKDYVKLLTRRRKCGFQVLSQCVTECKTSGVLLVTAVMEKHQSVNPNCAGQCGAEDNQQLEANDRQQQETDSSQKLLTDDSEDISEQKRDKSHWTERILHVGKRARKKRKLSLTDDQHESAVTVSSAHTSIFRRAKCSHQDLSTQTNAEHCDTVLGAFVDKDNVACLHHRSEQSNPNSGNYTKENCDSCLRALKEKEPLIFPRSNTIDTAPTTPTRDNNLQHCSKSTDEKPYNTQSQPPTSISACSQCASTQRKLKTCNSLPEVLGDIHQEISRDPPSRQMRGKPKSPKILSWVQMSVDSFVTELSRKAKQHCGLRDVHFFPVQDDWFVSGVWSPHCARNCYHRMGVSHLGLLPSLAEAAARNVQLRFLCQHEDEGSLYYALFWEGPLF